MIFGDPFYFEQSFVAVDRWLAEVEADNSDRPLAERIIANKPADIHDQCSDGLGHKLADEVCVELLRTPYAYGTARTVAGAAHYATNYACTLKPFHAMMITAWCRSLKISGSSLKRCLLRVSVIMSNQVWGSSPRPCPGLPTRQATDR